LTKHIKKPQKKKSNRNPGNKIPFNQTNKKTMEGDSSRLEQVEDRISDHDYKLKKKQKKC
jgi:hypothetical protein